MNCTKCGEQVSETARFCPACGMRFGGGSSLPERRTLLAVGGGVAVVLAAVVAATWYLKRSPPAAVAAGSPQVQSAGGEAANNVPVQLTPAQVSGFDWSGLSPEQLQSARAALDAAIAKEEQSRTGISKAVQTGDNSAH